MIVGAVPSVPEVPSVPSINRLRGDAIGDFLARNSKRARWRLDVSGLLYQTDDTSSPVTAAAQAVGRIEAASGSASPLAWTQASAGARGVWATTGITCDGGDYWEGDPNNSGLHQNIQSSVFGCAFTLAALTGTVVFCGWSTSAGGANRIRDSVTASGAISIQRRRLSSDSATILTSAGGLVTTGQKYTFISVTNWAANSVEVYLNGASVLTGALGGAGSTDDVASARVRLITDLGTTPTLFMTGSLHRQIFTAANATPVIPTAAEIAAMHLQLAA